uniref:Uncharacterized protein n=1 Tax=Arundo donax TaxID=35708 RepID=A0A0A9FIS6_ARUDO
MYSSDTTINKELRRQIAVKMSALINVLP